MRTMAETKKYIDTIEPKAFLYFSANAAIYL